MPNPPNSLRKRPSRSYSLSRESVDKLDDLALRTDQKRSVVLDNIISMVSSEEYLDARIRKVSWGPGEGDDVKLH